MARFVARSRTKDAPDLPRQPDPVRSDPDPRHVRPRGNAGGVPEVGEGDRNFGRGGPVTGGRVRHLRQHLGAHPRRRSTGTTARQIRRSRAVPPRRQLSHRSRDHAADRQADRKRSPYRRRRRHQLRVRPELHPRSRQPADRAGAYRARPRSPRRRPGHRRRTSRPHQSRRRDGPIRAPVWSASARRWRRWGGPGCTRCRRC